MNKKEQRTIKELSEVDRPREKLIKYGPNKLSDFELLAILLRSGKRGENVLDLAKRIIKKIGKSELPYVSYEELRKIKGVGPAKACDIIASFELGKRFLREKKARLYLKPKDVWDALIDIRDRKKEYFVIFYLDTRNQEIRRKVISVGTLNASLIHPREVFEPAVQHLAAQIIIAHNHPSGSLEPSAEDLSITKRLLEAGRILGIEITDHIIVTKDAFFSFKEKGLM